MEKTITIAKDSSQILELPESNEKLSIIAEPGSRVTIIDNVKTDRQIEIFAKENSMLNFLSLQNSDKDGIKIKRDAVVGRNAVINWLDCHFGGSSCFCETTNLLSGDNSSTNNFCLFFGNASQNFELKINSIHDGKNTASEILTRGVLDNGAKAKFKGLLQINKSADDCCAYQKSEVLLLSENAKADCIPELNIKNNDIRKCSHGASIGRIDEEKLFYLMSRGFARNNAVRQMVDGFFSSVLKKAGIESFNAVVQKLIGEKLSNEKNV